MLPSRFTKEWPGLLTEPAQQHAKRGTRHCGAIGQWPAASWGPLTALQKVESFSGGQNWIAFL